MESSFTNLTIERDKVSVEMFSYATRFPDDEKEHRPFKHLPEKIKRLAPCPFLETSEFSDIYVCGASKYVYVPYDSLNARETINKCAGNRYINCRHYVEAISKIRICPFLKRHVLLPGGHIYTCEASEYVHAPFSKIDEEFLSRNCIGINIITTVSYYLNVINTIKME